MGQSWPPMEGCRTRRALGGRVDNLSFAQANDSTELAEVSLRHVVGQVGNLSHLGQSPSK
jgi:hypothetical protein